MRVSSLNTCLSATLSRCAVLIPQVLLQTTIHDGSQALLIDIVIIAVRTLWKIEAWENHLCVDLEPEIECGLMTSTLNMTFLFVFSPFLLVFFVFSYLVRFNPIMLWRNFLKRVFWLTQCCFFGSPCITQSGFLELYRSLLRR